MCTLMKLQIILVLNKLFIRDLCHRPHSQKHFGSRTAFGSISLLRRVNNYTRSTMAQSMLCNLALLTIESELLDSISMTKLLINLHISRTTQNFTH